MKAVKRFFETGMAFRVTWITGEKRVRVNVKSPKGRKCPSNSTHNSIHPRRSERRSETASHINCRFTVCCFSCWVLYSLCLSVGRSLCCQTDCLWSLVSSRFPSSQLTSKPTFSHSVSCSRNSISSSSSCWQQVLIIFQTLWPLCGPFHWLTWEPVTVMSTVKFLLHRIHWVATVSDWRSRGQHLVKTRGDCSYGRLVHQIRDPKWNWGSVLRFVTHEDIGLFQQASNPGSRSKILRSESAGLTSCPSKSWRHLWNRHQLELVMLEQCLWKEIRMHDHVAHCTFTATRCFASKERSSSRIPASRRGRGTKHYVSSPLTYRTFF